MGWDFTHGASKADIIAEVTRTRTLSEITGATAACIAKSVRGNHLWTVFENEPDKERRIMLFLLARNRNYGWGYKDIDETMGPVDTDCPLRFLDMVPDPGSYATEWRNRVRKAAEKRSRSITVGDVVELPNCRPDRLTVTSVKPLRGRADNGAIFRFSRKMLA